MSRVEHLAEGVILHLGDCRDVLPAVGAVDMIFTDPPYGHNNNNGDLIHRRADRLPMMERKAPTNSRNGFLK